MVLKLLFDNKRSFVHNWMGLGIAKIFETDTLLMLQKYV